MVINTKTIIFETQCVLATFLNNVVLKMALKMLETYLSLVFGIHFSNLLQFSMIN